MGSAFSTKTIFQFVGTLDSAFALVIFAFGIKTVVLYQKYLNGDIDADSAVDTTPIPSFAIFTTTPPDPYAPYREDEREYIQYAAIFAVIGSIIQIFAAFLLVTKSKYSSDKFGNDIHPGPVPKIWIVHSLLQLVLHLAVSLGPTLVYDTFFNDPKSMQYTLNEFFTYCLVSAVFKCLLIWAVVSKLGGPIGYRHDGPLCPEEETADRGKDETKY